MTRNLPRQHRANARAQPGERCCFVSRQRLGRHSMVRFVYDAEHKLCLDAAEKLPGRGYWLAVEENSLTQGVQRLLSKTDGRKEAGELYETLKRGTQILETRCLSFLALARRAGQAVAGFARCREQAKGGRLRALICAEDEPAADCKKLLVLGGATMPLFRRFTALALGKIFARERIVYVGLCGTQPLARRGIDELERFEKFYNIFEAEETPSV